MLPIKNCFQIFTNKDRGDINVPLCLCEKDYCQFYKKNKTGLKSVFYSLLNI